MREEQQGLIQEIETTRDQNSKLLEMVDKSSVDAVDTARAERDEALRQMDHGIKDAQSKASHETYEAHEKQRKVEEEIKKAKEKLKKKTFLYFGLLALTLVCNGITNNLVVSDFIAFFKIPGTGLYIAGLTYYDWLVRPCYHDVNLALGWAWFYRIITVIIILAVIVITIKILCLLIQGYKIRWCTLSLKILVASLTIITSFGRQIKAAVPVNLVFLFFFIQIAYLIVLLYVDYYFENNNESIRWEEIKNK